MRKLQGNESNEKIDKCSVQVEKSKMIKLTISVVE